MTQLLSKAVILISFWLFLTQSKYYWLILNTGSHLAYNISTSNENDYCTLYASGDSNKQ